MNYLQQLLSTPKEPVVKTHYSLESLIGTIAPAFVNQPDKSLPRVDEKLEKQVEIIKQRAEELLQTAAEKLAENKISEEIEKDLKEAFLNESISIREAIDVQNYYKLYRDKDETFECKISVEGTSLGNSSVRLIIETEGWNILFYGKIYRDGRCVVPLKKMSIFPEGTIGKARLEVIIDDLIFIPWEETFIVEGAKKVTIEIVPQNKVSVNIKNAE